MKTTKTEIIFLLDRSGSMAGLESDTIGGFNGFIEKQLKLEGETTVTAVLFDDHYEILWNGIRAEDAKLTEDDYQVRGMTALLDAVGKTIVDVNHRFSEKQDNQPDNVLVVITTDGLENSSREFSYDNVKKLIKHQQDDAGWEFIFLGANIDVGVEAGRLGIDAEAAFNFEASSTGVEAMYDLVYDEVVKKRGE